MKFRLIDSGFNTPSMNMAIDEALLKNKLPVLRFYRWKPAGLSLGYFQDINDIDVEFCSKNDISVVRRLTGGKTVLHDVELTYSVIMDERLVPKSIIDSYKLISKGILIALHKLGVNASMKEEVEKKESSAVCFNDPSYYEIVVDGKKLVGSAQTRRDGKLLQHGAILLDIDVSKYVNCFNLKDKEKIINLTKERVTSINGEINKKESINYEIKNENINNKDSIKNLNKKNKIKKMTYEDVASAMREGFVENFNAEMVEDELSSDELKSAEKLDKERYSSDKWNLRV